MASSCFDEESGRLIVEISENEEDDREESQDSEYVGFYEKTFEGSERVDLASYFGEYSKSLPLTAGESKDPVLFLMQTSADDPENQVLFNYCNIDNLTVPGEVIKRTANRITWSKEMFENEKMMEDVELQTVKFTKARLRTPGELQKLKYAGEIPIMYEKKDEKPGDPLAVPGKDIIVTIRVHVPISRKTLYKGRFHKYKVASVISILGSQTLADLRDKITCISDFSVCKETSDDLLSTRCTVMAKDVYPSGFFYIDGTFYNDTRNSLTNFDYSQVIIDWAVQRNYGPFKTAVMEDTRIDNLVIRFGFPWVYQHQGLCEHIIVFSDARLCNPNDELSISAYPRISRTKLQQLHNCLICTVFTARWITFDNDRIPHNPCFLCNDCFKSYYYIDGKKIGDFKAYAYPIDYKTLKISMELKNMQ